MIDRKRLAETFKFLVQIDSISKEESVIANEIKRILESLGAETFVDNAGDKIGGNSGNLIAKFKGNTLAPPLLLNAHMDTVEPGRGITAVFENGKFTPLSSKSEITSNAWVIAATNQDLEKKVKERLFREDLYYRLSTIKIYIPPLHNRPEDISPLIDYFIERYAFQFDRKKISKPSPDVMEKLITYSWPGNVRELQSILKSSMVMGNWEEVVDDFSINDKPDVYQTPDQKGLEKAILVDTLLSLKNENSSGHALFSLKKIRKEAVNTIDKKVISFVLDKTGWNRTKASKILKISYKALLYKISDLDIKSSTQNR